MTDAVLQLKAEINVETMPVGDDGMWDWLAAVLAGKPGRIEFEEGQKPAQLVYAFGVLHRACELAGGVEGLKGHELALVAKRAAEDDPNDAQPESGACSWF